MTNDQKSQFTCIPRDFTLYTLFIALSLVTNNIKKNWSESVEWAAMSFSEKPKFLLSLYEKKKTNNTAWKKTKTTPLKKNDHYDELSNWWWQLCSNTLVCCSVLRHQTTPENVSGQPEACNYPHWYILDDENGTHTKKVLYTHILLDTHVCYSRLGKGFQRKWLSGPQSVHLCV